MEEFELKERCTCTLEGRSNCNGAAPKKVKCLFDYCKNKNKFVVSMTYKFRFIKMETYDGKWLTFNPSIQRLQRLIKKYNPKNVYVSVNQWLRYREHNTTYPNRILKKYDLIDIDGKHFSDREACRQYFESINKILLEHNIHVEEKIATNTTIGGYQLLLPYSKEFHELMKSGIFEKIDNVFDVKRVKRLPNTYNGNRQSFSCFVDATGHPLPQNLNTLNFTDYYSPGMLDNNANKHPTLCENLQYDGVGVSTTQDCFQADDRGAVKALTPPNKTNGRQAIRSKLPANFLVRQMSNSCFGASNLYVPVLKFKDIPLRRGLLKLQKTYNLGDLYIFRYHLGFYAISPKTAQFGRLIKIYRKLEKAGNFKSYNELTKFKQNFIYISNLIDLEGLRKIDTFGFIDVFEQDAAGYYSRLHANWLQKYCNKSYDNLIGNEKPKFKIGWFSYDR